MSLAMSFLPHAGRERRSACTFLNVLVQKYKYSFASVVIFASGNGKTNVNNNKENEKTNL